MDDIKPAASPTNNDGQFPQSSNGQVMDIQSPKPLSANDTAPVLPEADTQTAEADPVNVVGTEVSSDSISTEETSSAATPEATTQPSETPAVTPINVTDDTSASEQPAPTVSETSTPPSNETNPLAIPLSPPPSKKSGKPGLVIVIAVIIAVGLAGLVIFTFMKTKKDTVGTNKTANSAATQLATKPLASPADVDNTNKQIETSLSKVNDSTDFSSANLSDKSLGL